METTTITVRVSLDTRDRLDRLAEITRRSRSFLAAEAVEGYLRHELDIVDGIQRGIDDIKAGRVVPHEEAVKELRSRVRRAAAKTRRKSA